MYETNAHRTHQLKESILSFALGTKVSFSKLCTAAYVSMRQFFFKLKCLRRGCSKKIVSDSVIGVCSYLKKKTITGIAEKATLKELCRFI